ncbi:MAG: DUF4190 domain-containing protein [Myxococcales bacterium]|nr:DUF4190 domain-containing protein [Myxococcales bacterium]
MAFCPRCAAPNVDTAAACAACGSPIAAAGAPGSIPPMNQQFVGAGGGAMMPKTNGLAIAGFICAFLCSIVGIILSAVALSQIKKSNGTQKGEGLALAGIIIGSIFFVVGIIIQVAARR